MKFKFLKIKNKMFSSNAYTFLFQMPSFSALGIFFHWIFSVFSVSLLKENYSVALFVRPFPNMTAWVKISIFSFAKKNANPLPWLEWGIAWLSKRTTPPWLRIKKPPQKCVSSWPSWQRIKPTVISPNLRPAERAATGAHPQTPRLPHKPAAPSWLGSQ